MAENNIENNSQNKNNKSVNWGFTLFACVATGIIVFLSMNLGEKASKIVNPDTGSVKTSNITSDENSNSNIIGNETSNSNVTSNVASNSNVVANQAANIPATDLIAYSIVNSMPSEIYLINNGTLYYAGKNSEENIQFVNTPDNNKLTKVLDNVKRIKVFHSSSDMEPTFLAIMNDGSVKHVSMNYINEYYNKPAQFSITDDEYFKDYKVEDISDYRTNTQYGIYIKFTLTDGTSKTIDQKR